MITWNPETDGYAERDRLASWYASARGMSSPEALALANQTRARYLRRISTPLSGNLSLTPQPVVQHKSYSGWRVGSTRTDGLVKNVRSRLGSAFVLQHGQSGDSGDALDFGNAPGLRVINCSASWSTDEALSVYNSPGAVISRFIVSEPLNAADLHPGEPLHGLGSIFAGVPVQGTWGNRPPMLIEDGIYAHCWNRSPALYPELGSGVGELVGELRAVVRGLLVYNFGFSAVQISTNNPTDIANSILDVDMHHCVFIEGPDSAAHATTVKSNFQRMQHQGFHCSSCWYVTAGGVVHDLLEYMEVTPALSRPSFTDYYGRFYDSPWDIANRAVGIAGARPLDDHDRRVINHIATGGGSILDYEWEAAA